MQNFEASDDKPERIGKVIGDALAALIILAVLILVFNTVFPKPVCSGDEVHQRSRVSW
jgi:acyl dehydratase